MAKVLSNSSWRVTSQIWDGEDQFVPNAEGAGPMNLNAALVTGEWRVVHIAAHGLVGDDTQPGGIVLGDGQFITPSVFGSLGIVPDLVFVNACHLGTIGHSVAEPRSALAGINNVSASVARALMQIRVRAVVVAGWAINDLAASAFATTLYSSMLDHSTPFGVAVQHARKEAKEIAPYSQTWGAYQCYGDAGFRLLGRRATKATSWPRPTTEAGYLRRIGWVIADAGENGRNGKRTAQLLIKELDELCDEVYRARPTPPDDSKTEVAAFVSDVLARLGDAYSTLRKWEPAIALDEWSMRQEKAFASLRTIEQLGNVLSRSAVGRQDAETRFDEADAWLRRSLEFGSTGERHALLGSNYKRWAVATSDPGKRTKHFKDAYDHYGHALQRLPNSYHCCLRVQLSTMAAYDQDVDLQTVAEEFREWLVTKYTRDDSSFWGRATAGDLELTKWLVNEATGKPTFENASIGRAAESYVQAFELRSSDNERDSVTSHIRDLSALALSATVKSALADAAAKFEGWKP